MAKVFPDIKYLIQTGILRVASLTVTNGNNSTGSAYQAGDVYCLSVTAIDPLHGTGSKFEFPRVETSGLSVLHIDFLKINHPDYYVTVEIKDQLNEIIKNENVKINGITSAEYDVSTTESIKIALFVSMADGINTLQLSNIYLI